MAIWKDRRNSSFNLEKELLEKKAKGLKQGSNNFGHQLWHMFAPRLKSNVN